MTPTFFAKAAMEEGATVVVEPASKPNPKPKKGKRSQKEALPSIVKEIASNVIPFDVDRLVTLTWLRV
eukprot:m.79729 g.79729  ORF g.79729 m.79729 type:complete len:68 (+) comp14525_c0_seq4:820-1023(+)